MRCHFAAGIPSIDGSGGFNKHYLTFLLRDRPVLQPTANDMQVPRSQMDVAIAILDRQFALVNEEQLIRLIMLVPDELTERLHALDMDIVHLRNDVRGAALGKLTELVREIDGQLRRQHDFLLIGEQRSRATAGSNQGLACTPRS